MMLSPRRFDGSSSLPSSPKRCQRAVVRIADCDPDDDDGSWTRRALATATANATLIADRAKTIKFADRAVMQLPRVVTGNDPHKADVASDREEPQGKDPAGLLSNPRFDAPL